MREAGSSGWDGMGWEYLCMLDIGWVEMLVRSYSEWWYRYNFNVFLVFPIGTCLMG